MLAGSGLFLSTYMALHIPTTISGITGPYGYNEALKIFRYVCIYGSKVENKRRYLILALIFSVVTIISTL